MNFIRRLNFKIVWDANRETFPESLKKKKERKKLTGKLENTLLLILR